MPRVWAALAGVLCCLSPQLATIAEAEAPPVRAAGPPSAADLEKEVSDLAAWVAAERGRLSASVVAVRGGAVLAASQPDSPLNPASNMKIVTAAAALDLLGPEFTFTTGVYGDSDRGAVDTLVLRGHGDPSLTAADLWRLARSIAQRGVTRVHLLQVDQSRFDAQYVPPAFDQQPDEWATFRAPVSAIAVDRNAVTLNVVPSRPDQPAEVWFDPPGFVVVSGEVRTTAAGGGQAVRFDLAAKDGRLEARLGGHISAELPRMRFERRVDDPRLMPGYVFAALLEEQGVEVGAVAAGGASVRRRLTYVGSEPLSVLLRELGKNSDNFSAEMVFKALGGTGDAPASSAVGARAVVAWLHGIGAWSEKARIVNGSGLFDANRLSASMLTRVLAYAYLSPKISPDFVSQLAIGGVDGTIRSRFREHRSDRSIRAKSGTLRDVVALSGYVLGDGERPPVAFAFVVEGIAGKHGEIRDRIDAVVRAIARRR